MAATALDWGAQNEYFRECVQEALAEPQPHLRAHALRHVLAELDGLTGWVESYLEEAVEAQSQEAWRLAFHTVRENADYREELIRRGMATPGRCDALGLVSHESLDEAAEAGELYEAAFGALERLGPGSGGGALNTFLERLHPRDRLGKFRRKPGSDKLMALVHQDTKSKPEPKTGLGDAKPDTGRATDTFGPGTVAREVEVPATGKPEKVFKTQPVTSAELAVQGREGLAPGQRPVGMSRRQAQQERPRTREGARRLKGPVQSEEEVKAAREKDVAKRQKSMEKRVRKEVKHGSKTAQYFNPAHKVSQKSLLEYVRHTLTTPSTADAHSHMENGVRVYDADRQQVHEAIIDVMLRRKNADRTFSATNEYLPSQAQPSVLFMGGGYAAGKTSAQKMLEARGEVPADAITINPDDVKAMLPEFAATATHDPEANLRVYEEAWDVAQELQRRAQERHLNIIVDGITNTSTNEVYDRVQGFKDAGYGNVRIAYVDVPTEVALQRAGARAKKAAAKAEAGDPSAAADMRHIPDVIMRAVHRDVAATIPAVMNDPRRKALGVDVEVYDGQSNALPIARRGANEDGITVLHDPAWRRLLDKADERIADVDASKSETDPFKGERLPENHADYFDVGPDTQTIPVEDLVPSKPPESQPHSVDVAEQRMRMAASGEGGKRGPITVRDNGDGSFTVVDGNATLGAAIRSDWKTLPVQVVDEQGNPVQGDLQTGPGVGVPAKEGEDRALSVIKEATADLGDVPVKAPLQPWNTEEELFGAAPKVQEEFLDLLDRGLGVSRDIDGTTHINSGPDDWPATLAALKAEPNKPHIVIAPMKTAERARVKVVKYDGNYNRLTDVVRGTIAVPTIDDLKTAFESVKQEAVKSGWQITAIENRMVKVPGSPNDPGGTSSGYTDFNIRLESPDGMQTELQFNTIPMMLAKEGDGSAFDKNGPDDQVPGHVLYERERDIVNRQQARGLPLSAAQHERVFELRKRQMRLYTAAWNAGMTGAPTAA